MFRFLAMSWPIIALAFPVLELLGLIRMWGLFGLWTLVWLLLAAAAGMILIASERVAFMPRLMESMLAGGNPFALLMASGLRFLAGLLLILPGAISDAIALILLLASLFRPPRPPGTPRQPGSPIDEDGVIEGDFRRID